MGLVRAGSAMATATAASRVTGLVRTLVVVTALGMGTRLLDAYTAANATPNMVYELVMGGAVASVLVPLLTRAADSEPDPDLFAQRLLSLVLYGLAAVVAVALVAAPLLVAASVPGFTGPQRQLTLVLTRFFLPQIAFYGLSAALAAILNARGRFGTPLWAPVANNLVVIATALGYLLVGGAHRPPTGPRLLLLALGTTAGVAAQLAVLVVAVRRAGFPLRLRADPRGIGVRRITAMAGWTIGASVAAQLSFLVATRLASGAGTGALGEYANAATLFQVPYALIAVSVITGMLPRMSRAAAARDLAALTADLSAGLRLSAAALMPVAAALVVLGPRLGVLLFAHGGTGSAGAAQRTGAVLAVYGLALVPFAGYQIMQRVFYALGDTRTPALLSVGVSGVSIAAGLTAARWLTGGSLLAALAAGTGLAYAAGSLVTAVLLRRRLGRVDGHRLLDTYGRMLAAAALAGVAAAATARLLGAVDLPGWAGGGCALGGAALVGAGLYLLAARGLRIGECAVLLRALRPGRA